MNKVSKIKRLQLVNKSLKKILIFEQKNIKHNETIENLIKDIKAKDKVISHQEQDLVRIYNSKLWKIYLFFRPFLNIFKSMVILSFYYEHNVDFT
jgi:hypothetical protein